MPAKLIDKLDYRFIIILVVGIVLRTITFALIPIPNDAKGYIKAAESIFNGNYDSFRFPSFPLFVMLFLLVIEDSIVAIKLASLLSGIFAIIASYFVFTKASLIIFGRNEDGIYKSKYVGLLVSFYMSINFFLVYNNGRGLREEFMMVLLILLFYFIFISENCGSLKNLIIVFVLFSIFTLSHITAGIFTFVSILLYYLFSKSKIIKNIIKTELKISNLKFFTISISFICSHLFWIIFCTIHFGDPLYTINRLRYYWKDNSNMELEINSLGKIMNLIKYSIENGINRAFLTLFFLIGPIFIFIIILTYFKYLKNAKILFLYLFLFINFLYLSIFLAFNGAYRLLIYFFPFLFFLGSILIMHIWYEKRDAAILNFKIFKKELSISSNLIFLLYLITFTIKNILSLVNYILDISFSIKITFLIIISYILLFIYEFFLLVFLIRNITISVDLSEHRDSNSNLLHGVI
jgi:hypothetical protein